MDDGALRHGIATAIRTLRAERRWTQRELCRRAALSPAYLSEIEAGRKDGSADVLERVADAFGIGMDELLWCILLGVNHGEIPGVERRDSALRVARDMIDVAPEIRRDVEQFIAFRRWQSADPSSKSRNKLAERFVDSDGEKPDITEES